MGALPQFLIRLQPTRPQMLRASTPEEDRVVEAHFAYLQGLTAEGTVLLAGRTLQGDPSSFGLVIIQAGTEEEAQRVMRDDPAIAGGVFRGELLPYRIALVSERILPSD